MLTATPQTSMVRSQFTLAGYDIVRGFLAAEEVRSFALLVKDVLALVRLPCVSRPGNDLIPLRWNDPLIAQILSCTSRINAVRELLGAPDLRWLSGYVSTKPAKSPVLWWHQDWWCWDHPISFQLASPQVAVLCYLDDTSERNGALRVLPGSHRKSTALHAHLPEPHGAAANALPSDHPAMSDQPGQETLCVDAGDAVVIDYRLLHGTHANRTLADRNCVLLSFIPDWRGLPAEIKAHLISHSALPVEAEAGSLGACPYSELLPQFEGTRADLPVRRLPPSAFVAAAPGAATPASSVPHARQRHLAFG